MHQLFEAQAARTPQATALVFREQSLSYQEMNARANQIAHRLRKLGVGPETLVGIYMERSLEMVLTMYAILKAGGAYVPLDPSYPQERLAFMLADTNVSVVLTQEHLQAQISHLPSATVLCLDKEDFAAESTANVVSGVQEQHLAYVIYTSGSTGQPKGVMIEHQGICNQLQWMQSTYPLTTADAVLLKTPFSFDLSLYEFFSPLLAGAKLVIAEPEGQRDSSYLIQAIQRERITTLFMVPSHLQLLLEDETFSACTSLKDIFCSGESLPFALQQRFFAQMPHTNLHNLYGPTEASVECTYWDCERDTTRTIVPIGRPIANYQIHLLDEQLTPVPVGQIGELFISGIGLARGYWNRPALTAERFVTDAGSGGHRDAGAGEVAASPRHRVTASRLYKTGDLARLLPDGVLECLGRVDFQVKIRGHRIELGEIEAVLTAHPKVRDCVVLAREDAPGGKQLVAYLVLRETPTACLPTECLGEWRDLTRRKLPDYMQPAAFVVLADLPRTPNGKTDRKALPPPDATAFSGAETYVAPRNSTEEKIAAIWSEVLGLAPIGIHEQFFVLGGHSLLASQVIARVRATWQIELPLRTMFSAPTIAGLAEAVTAQQTTTAPPRALLKATSRTTWPLSFAQQRLWFLDQLEPNTATYNVSHVVRLAGALNVAALQQAVQAIIARHDLLRASFVARAGQPVFTVAEAVQIELPLVDLRATPDEAPQRAAALANTPFDLSRAPLLRLALLKLSDTEHQLLIVFHHIISDGWSLEVFLQELGAFYQAQTLSAQTLSAQALPELPLQYADYAVWQQESWQREGWQEQLQFWQQHLAAAPALLELPTDRPRPATQRHQGAQVSRQLPSQLRTELQALAQREGATLFMTLLAAWQILLARYARQEQIVVGTPSAGRTHVETENLLGFFVNTLALRGDLSGNPTWQEFLQRTRVAAMSAYAHQDLPFEKLVEALQPERSLSHTPIFQVMFALQNAPRAERQWGELALTVAELPNHTAKFDLTLFVDETPDGWQARLEFDTDLFELATAERLLDYWQTLLQSIVANPTQTIQALPWRPATQPPQWLAEAPPMPVPSLCLHQLFEAQAARTPTATALVFQEQSLSYQELNARANQIAHRLRQLGVGPETLVGIYMERSLEMVLAIYAILKAGGAYVPLDPSYPQERLAFMLADTNVSVVLTQEHLQSQISNLKSATLLCLDKEDFTAESTANLPSDVAGHHLAYVIYTSGSTGQPKGAMIEQRGLVNYLTWCLRTYPLHEGTGSVVHSSLSFDLTITSLLAPLLAGKRVILAPPDLGVEALCQILREERDLSLIKITPAHLKLLGEQLRPEEAAGRTRAFVIGGENLTAEHVAFWRRHAPETRLFNEYGPTETVVGCCVYEVPADQFLRGVIPIGHPISNTQLYLLDEQQQDVPDGAIGELYIGGAGVGRGYWNRPALTAEKFIGDRWPVAGGWSSEETTTDHRPPTTDHRLYRTGDLARRRPDGLIECLGRTDFQVKIRGYRIELGEIEAALNSHPAIVENVVVAREETPGERRLVAYYVTAQEADVAREELRDFLRQKLADYMLPALFVRLAALPLSPNGKIARQQLPVPHELPRTADFAAPASDSERQLQAIWEAALRLSPISVTENFFALGGHSLLAVRLFAAIEETFGKRLPLATLFRFPTIRQLAQLLEQQDWQPSWSSLVPLQRAGAGPPFFCVHAAGGNVLEYYELAQQLGTAQPFFGLQAVGLDGQQPPLTTIEAQATHYLHAIRQVQPTGPYYLGGRSSGGLVAYEMAQQLRAQGEAVALVALLDTDPTGWLTLLPTTTALRLRLRFLARRIRQHLHNLRGLGWRRQSAYVQEKLAYKQRQLASWRWQWQRLFAAGQPGLNVLEEVEEFNYQAVKQYRPRVYPDRVTFFCAQEEVSAEENQFGWQTLAAGGVEVVSVPGNHQSMIREPHVRCLAQQLRLRLTQ